MRFAASIPNMFCGARVIINEVVKKAFLPCALLSILWYTLWTPCHAIWPSPPSSTCIVCFEKTTISPFKHLPKGKVQSPSFIWCLDSNLEHHDSLTFFLWNLTSRMYHLEFWHSRSQFCEAQPQENVLCHLTSIFWSIFFVWNAFKCLLWPPWNQRPKQRERALSTTLRLMECLTLMCFIEMIADEDHGSANASAFVLHKATSKKGAPLCACRTLAWNMFVKCFGSRNPRVWMLFSTSSNNLPMA